MRVNLCIFHYEQNVEINTSFRVAVENKNDLYLDHFTENDEKLFIYEISASLTTKNDPLIIGSFSKAIIYVNINVHFGSFS